MDAWRSFGQDRWPPHVARHRCRCRLACSSCRERMMMAGAEKHARARWTARDTVLICFRRANHKTTIPPFVCGLVQRQRVFGQSTALKGIENIRIAGHKNVATDCRASSVGREGNITGASADRWESSWLPPWSSYSHHHHHHHHYHHRHYRDSNVLDQPRQMCNLVLCWSFWKCSSIVACFLWCVCPYFSTNFCRRRSLSRNW